MLSALDHIIINGARQHNLKDIDLAIPKNKFVVFTGVSGSGKSSLAMDTIYAEGQRRYVESLSAYARQFLGVMDKPDVDKIEGLSPAIAIDQKTTSRNPRSTVGTVTEVYDFLRLIYARIGHPHCPNCGREIQRQSSDQIVNQIFEIISKEKDYKSDRGVRFMILSPIVKDRKGEFSALFDNLKKQGIIRARIDRQIRDIGEKFDLIKTNKHSIDALISRQIVSSKRLSQKEDRKSLELNVFQSVETALRMGNGNVVVSVIRDKDFDFTANPENVEDRLFSENFACPECNISLPELEPRSFSFNSPHGACPNCDGLGTELNVDIELVLKPNLTIAEGGVLPWSKLFEHYSWTAKVIETVSKEYDFSLDIPIQDLQKTAIDLLLYGAPQGKKFKVRYRRQDGTENSYMAGFEGVVPNLLRRHKETSSDYIRNEIEKFMVRDPCPVCEGSRLKKEVLSVVIDKKNISEATDLSIENVKNWLTYLPNVLSQKEKIISSSILKEIDYRLNFLLDVGLGYLTLSRASAHLSGGEAQRIRLASQIGSGLSGVLYVLDEPSIGLHQRDQGKLVNTLKHLRDLGNTVLVVEHDAETMMECDYIFDFGPGAGVHGGKVVSEGRPADIMQDPESITGKYLSGEKVVGDRFKKPKEIELINYDDIDPRTNLSKTKLADLMGKSLSLKKAGGRNLKNIDLNVPFGKFTCITGVSGSGKSTLIMDTLYKELRQEFGLKNEERPEPNEGILGTEYVTNVIAIDQSPIGRTPKSNPATYTKVFDHIRDLFSKTEEARVRGYNPGRFSFNVKGGRCEACGGEGQIKIEMQFMPDVYVNCEVCQGKRYNKEALEIHYKGMNISNVLDMNVEDALGFFENIPAIRRKLQTLFDVGLGYIKLGQPAPTLSGGEAQRVKLALELSKRSMGNTFYILDEPTTGLHFADLENLISIIKRLTAKGNTVVVIEHNLDVVANADWVIDLGPEGGDAGGRILFEGDIAALKDFKGLSYTAEALRETKVKSRIKK
ncbi:MAG: UvrABC system protein A [candidate division WWE3 bacterium GW2011_GWC1_41_7]|uniref:UvrABC system protein A n=3 Tax=Katanobacteria TaxID=422282 RepID=A0A0G1ABQ0_UNCKA|nr:MAG: UvrABC system protein A [candidate division WWE3 bacterium GW2011_GWB1_41_6]KKS21340.1 MAG: UvrABC system protein A [candidate division WWE3 bacterium GW2011_GWC1_41_7]KKS22663.1 MAG: UvrABC system protein A [candidate division WWE3 bacterium GW2011_GWA1_41_8]